MEGLEHKPNIYEGSDPFIYISCHPDDKSRIYEILEKLDMRGFRFWTDDGITPGMEADEIIASHIENCDLFIAFISENYLGFLDKVDELNYSRDVNKEYLLVYLDDVVLPAGLDMRFMRAQSIPGYAMGTEDIYGNILHINSVDRFYGIADENLRGTAKRVFDKLESLYPDHKVFALDEVGKQLSKEISTLYVKAGYPSAERLMLDYGFVRISKDEARSLRSSVLYQPGFEPDVVKPRIDYIISALENDYPNKVITDNLSKSHKNIYNSLLGLSVWLGYDSAADMLSAYGFSGMRMEAGRIAIDHNLVLKQLEERYADKTKPSSLSDLKAENPDLAANIKTLVNRAPELFGMSLLQYLKNTGLIISIDKGNEERTSLTARNREICISEIKALYEKDAIAYGTFEEAQEALDQIVIKRNSKGEIYITDCSSCGESMKIPYGISFISKDAFTGQSDLVELILPPTLLEIREGAFSDCECLQRISFSEGLQNIRSNAFENCTALTEIRLPASLKSIGNEVFAGCDQLETVVFGNLRTNVQEDAFDGCVYVLENLQDEKASPAEFFELTVDKKNNAKITAYSGDEEIVVVPGTIGGHPVVSIEKGCFKGNNAIREVYISDEISALNGDVFRDCKNLTKVHLPEAVSKLTGTIFAGCTSLTEINIPDSMTEIQRGLFKDAPLTTLYLGKGVSRISPDAFYKGEADFVTGGFLKCKSLERLDIDTRNDSFSADGTTLLSKDRKKLITELGDPVKAVIPEGVEEISPLAYDRLSALSEVVFPSTLKRIGEKAFAGTNLKSVEFPPALETIDVQAFSFCRSLSAIDLNDGIKTIGQQAFEGCPIEDVYIPASIEILGSDSFLAISTFQGQITQRFRVDSANTHIFADGVALYQKSEESLILVKAYWSGLRLKQNEEGPEPLDYSIREGTTDISAHAFARCNNLRSVVIPEGVRSIGDMCFWDCNLLKEVHIPQSCTEVSPKAFFGTTITFI